MSIRSRHSERIVCKDDMIRVDRVGFGSLPSLLLLPSPFSKSLFSVSAAAAPAVKAKPAAVYPMSHRPLRRAVSAIFIHTWLVSTLRSVHSAPANAAIRFISSLPIPLPAAAAAASLRAATPPPPPLPRPPFAPYGTVGTPPLLLFASPWILTSPSPLSPAPPAAAPLLLFLRRPLALALARVLLLLLLPTRRLPSPGGGGKAISGNRDGVKMSGKRNRPACTRADRATAGSLRKLPAWATSRAAASTGLSGLPPRAAWAIPASRERRSRSKESIKVQQPAVCALIPPLAAKSRARRSCVSTTL